MSKLDIKIDDLNNDFINKINNGLNNLNNIINLLEKLDKPKSFSYSSYLKKLPNEIKNIKEECIDIKNYVVQSCINYNNTSNDIEEIIKKSFD